MSPQLFVNRLRSEPLITLHCSNRVDFTVYRILVLKINVSRYKVEQLTVYEVNYVCTSDENGIMFQLCKTVKNGNWIKTPLINQYYRHIIIWLLKLQLIYTELKPVHSVWLPHYNTSTILIGSTFVFNSIIVWLLKKCKGTISKSQDKPWSNI